jgi:hypothetical protein
VFYRSRPEEPVPRTLAGSHVALQPVSNKEDKLIRVEATPLLLLTLPFAMRREPEKSVRIPYSRGPRSRSRVPCPAAAETGGDVIR